MATNADSRLPPGVAVVLTTEKGVKVYLVGVTHISRNSIHDAVSAIQSVQPGIVFLELDQGRYRMLVAQAEDPLNPYGGVEVNLLKVLQAAVGIRSPEEFTACCKGAIMAALSGTSAGHEFYAADEAAKEVGAVVVQGDRPSSVNDARLPPAEQRRLLFNDLLFILWFAWQVVTDASTSETFNQPEDAAQDSKSMDMPVDLALGEEDHAKESTRKDNPWAQKEDNNKPTERPDPLTPYKTFLQEGGCANADVAMASFKKLMRAAWASKPIDIGDVAAARDCLRPLFELDRDEFLREARNIADRLSQVKVYTEADARMPVKAGLTWADVFVTERDIILARGLWEAGQQSGDRPVVGVVGAGHLKGIIQHWPNAGSLETKTLADEFCQKPTGGGVRALTGVLAGGGALAVCAYKYPRATKVLVGTGLTATVASAAVSSYLLYRLARTTKNIVEAAIELDKTQGNDPRS